MKRGGRLKYPKESFKNKFIKEIPFDLDRDDFFHISMGIVILTISIAIVLAFPFFLTVTHFGDWFELTLDNLFSLK